MSSTMSPSVQIDPKSLLTNKILIDLMTREEKSEVY